MGVGRMIPKKCKNCEHYMETVASRMESQIEWTIYNPTKKECTISDDHHFHFYCDEFKEEIE
jgi:hypothetical protein